MYRYRLSQRVLLICILCCIGIGCKHKDRQVHYPEIAVANSYLESIIKDLHSDKHNILSLVPPGMCPGHFDISPSQVNQLCNCRMLFVFDFQRNIENAIPRIKEQGLQVYKLKPLPGLCIPDTYFAVAEQVAAILADQYPDKKNYYAQRIKEIKIRLKSAGRDIKKHIEQSGWKDTKVIVSQYQAAFAKWLGLDPVSTFAGRDNITPAQINRNLQQGVQNKIRLIIANKQEGTGLAQALAEHLNVKMAVFSNFPDAHSPADGSGIFDNLMRDNVCNLLKALK